MVDVRSRLRLRRVAAAVSTLTLVGAALVAQPGLARAEGAQARYIVSTYTATGADAAAERLDRVGSRVSRRYSRVLNGFAASMTPAQAAVLRADPRVRLLVPDTRLSVASTETDAPWGLDRADQRSASLDQRYSYLTTGAGVTVYEIDTAVRLDHTDLGGRATSGYDFVDRDGDSDEGCTDPDSFGYGHGTHVAGTVIGSTYGVAKQARLVSLRVLDCDGEGSVSDFIAALQWVLTHRSGPSVVNISAGGDQNSALDEAVAATVKAGVPVVVAAGNDDELACSSSPADVPSALTVAASTRSDERASYSDYGACVDVFAPGSGIRSAWPTGSTDSAVLSGTSMATPHVTGAVARYLQAYPTASPAAVRAALVGDATSKALDGVGKGSPNKLLYLRGSTTGAPTQVSLTRSDSAHTATLSWQPPYGFGAPAVSGYRVTRSGTDSAGATFGSVDVPAGRRSYAFTDLRPGSTYALSVTPLNSAGPGSPGSSSVTMLALPGPGRVRTPAAGSTKDGSVSVTAKWKAPSSGGAVKTYSVQSRRVGTTTTTSHTATAGKRSLKLTKLHRNAAYEVRVRAGNAAGTGAWSGWSKSAKAR